VRHDQYSIQGTAVNLMRRFYAEGKVSKVRCREVVSRESCQRSLMQRSKRDEEQIVLRASLEVMEGEQLGRIVTELIAHPFPGQSARTG